VNYGTKRNKVTVLVGWPIYNRDTRGEHRSTNPPPVDKEAPSVQLKSLKKAFHSVSSAGKRMALMSPIVSHWPTYGNI
jgi:hypothetical protein